MFFGLTIEKILVLGVIAAMLVGPERLPRYAETLADWTKRAREYLSTAKTRVKDEMGEDFQDVDWRSLDPRQYDPRRIIREALLDDPPVPALRAATAGADDPGDGGAGTDSTNSAASAAAGTTGAGAPQQAKDTTPADSRTPIDTEAT